jgi:hypothetical protein
MREISHQFGKKVGGAGDRENIGEFVWKSGQKTGDFDVDRAGRFRVS